MVRHVVLFSFNFPLESREVQELNSNFDKLPSLIPEVASYSAGSNMSPENLEKGYQMCYVLDFNTPEDRDTYLVHPHHKAFVEKAGPVIKDALVFDYIPGEL
ncbi:MAG: Dabb family protein [Spirochaetales bacterium]|nr:Dabb family protein [Spirochaetales bacterium]